MRPRDPIELLVARACAETLQRPWVGVRDRLLPLAADPAARERMLQRVAREAGVPDAVADLADADTVEAIARALKESSKAIRLRARGFWARHLEGPPGVERPILFFFHGELEGGLAWFRVTGRLGADQPVYGISPRATIGEPMPATVEACASVYLDTVRALQPVGPYLLGGHCNGAVAAYEAARQLVAAGERIIGVLLVAPLLPATYRRGFGGLGMRFVLPVLDRAWSHGLPLALSVRAALWRDRPLPFKVPRRPVERWGGEFFEQNSAVVQKYRPPATRVPTVIFWPRQEPWRYRVPSARAWRRTVPHASHVALSGTHMGCAIDHVEETAAAMRVAIDGLLTQAA